MLAMVAWAVGSGGEARLEEQREIAVSDEVRSKEEAFLGPERGASVSLGFGGQLLGEVIDSRTERDWLLYTPVCGRQRLRAAGVVVGRQG